MSKQHVPEDKRALYQTLVDNHPQIELKGSTKLPYTSLNGNMFSQMTKAGKLGLRLAQADRETFIETYNTGLLTNYGTVMKEYVEVPDELLANTSELAPYLAKSYDYAKTLKAK